jgi:hypothetical protein
MKYFYATIFFLFLLPQFSNAQSNFKPGFLIDLKGDTIKGFVDYREWGKNPESFSFKATTGAAKQYTLQTAKGFAVDNFEYFERHVIPISQDVVDVAHLSSNSADTTIIDTVFLRVLTKGRISLYTYTDKIKTRFYISDNNSDITELIYKVYLDENGGDYHTINRYRTQLQYIAQKAGADNNSLADKIQNSRYAEDELTKIVQAINGTKGNTFTPQSHFGARLFAGVFACYNKLQFNGDKAPFLDGTSQSHIAPKLGFGVDLFTNKNTQRLFFRTEVSIMADHYNFPYSSIRPSNETINSEPKATLDFKQYTISVAPQVIYNFYATDKLKAFIGVGASFNFSSFNNYDYKINYNDLYNEVKNKYPEFEKEWNSLLIRTGFAVNKRFEFNFAYVVPASMTTYSFFSANYSSYQAGVNYLFN